MTYTEAYNLVPKDAVWSCSFGYSGETGFNDYFTLPNGKKFVVHNDLSPFGDKNNFNVKIID